MPDGREAVTHERRQSHSQDDLFGALMEQNKVMNDMAVEMGRLGEKVDSLTRLLMSQQSLPDRVTKLETRLEEQDKRVKSNQWLITLLATIVVGLLAIVVSHANWK